MLLGTVLSSGLLLTACTTGSITYRFAVGADGTILATSDGGTTWTPQASHTGNDLTSVSFAGTKKGCAVGLASTVVATTDGSTWSKVSNVPKGDWRSVDTYQNIGFDPSPYPANVIGTAVGDNGRIMTTVDGCMHWTKRTSGTTNDLLGVSMLYGSGNGLRAFAVGQHGTILYTSDGTTWSAQTSGTTHDVRGVYSQGSGIAYAVGEHGVLLNTTNAGGTWTAQSSGVTTRLNSVVFNGLTAFAVGEAGVILTTIDGGTTWTAQTSGTTRELRAVSLTGSDIFNVMVVGDHGTLLTTTDGGTTWTSQTSGTTKTLRGGVI
ncbi:MAG TPA: YCF48-related protein [Candidatus Dormibacteraeota bacterium]|nr:YCF48-related protein [Candidatus Dormibacteraeota bacterium]